MSNEHEQPSEWQKWKMPSFPTDSARQFTGRGWHPIDARRNAEYLESKRAELQERLEAHNKGC